MLTTRLLILKYQHKPKEKLLRTEYFATQLTTSRQTRHALTRFRTAVPFWGQTTQNLGNLLLKRDRRTKRVNSGPYLHEHSNLVLPQSVFGWGMELLNPFIVQYTAVPFGGQSTWNESGLSPNRDGSPRGSLRTQGEPLSS